MRQARYGTWIEERSALSQALEQARRRKQTEESYQNARKKRKALEQALLAFSSETEASRSRVVVLITDGENHEDDAIAVAERAAAQGIRIYTIGIGTPEGAPIRIDGDFIKDDKGDMVVSKLNEEMLSRIAGITEGAYVRATKQSIGLDEIVESINRLEQSELAAVRFEEYNEQYQYLLAAALLLLVVELLLLDRRNPLLARFNIFAPQSGTRKS